MEHVMIEEILENMLEGYALHKIVTDARGVPKDYIFLDVNKAFEKLTGLKKKNILNKNVTSVIKKLEKEWIKSYGDVALKGKSMVFEKYAEPLKKWYNVSAFSPKRGYFVTIFTDITEIRNEHDKLRKYIDIANVIVLGLDKKGIIELINKKGSELCGKTEKEMIGTSWFDFIPDDEKKSVMSVFRKILNGNSGLEHFSNSIVSADGKKRIVMWSNSVIKNERGEVICIISSGEDITEKSRIEAEKKKKAEEMERFNDISVGRELRMIELKKRIKELEKRISSQGENEEK